MLIGVYNPANRDETRDEFRIGFLNALDARIRNLVSLGKRVFLTGDLNIIREEIDTANAEEQLKKQGISGEQYVSTPARRMLNQLLLGGKVFGEKDEGREKPVMWDICRLFHPTRRGMFTCWEQKINARPGNFGSRIDYVLCSYSWNDWFCESNIQEGLMGSDHCPVYAVIKQKVEIDGQEVDIRDIMSAGFFKHGVRQREWTTKDTLPMSARLIPEFDRRRSIRDMFAKKPSLPGGESSLDEVSVKAPETKSPSPLKKMSPPASHIASASTTAALSPQSKEIEMLNGKRQIEQTLNARSTKRIRSASATKAPSTATKGQLGKGQSSLMGFFKPKSSQLASAVSTPASAFDAEPDSSNNDSLLTPSRPPSVYRSVTPPKEGTLAEAPSPSKPFSPSSQRNVVDPIAAKEGWSKIMKKRVVPRCDDHDEPCISMKTKKPGENCGRSFFMCSRPLGPSGQKEKKTQWRCGTFIWSSDWTGDMT